MVLALVHNCCGLDAVGLAGRLDAAHERTQDRLGAVIDKPRLVGGIEKRICIDEVTNVLQARSEAGAATHDVRGSSRRVLHGVPRGHVGHVAAVGSEQILAHHLNEYRVIAFKGRVDVRVRAVGGEAVFRHVARAPAGLAAFLDGARGVGGVCGLDGGGERLHLPGGEFVLVRGLGDGPRAGALLFHLLLVAVQDLVVEKLQCVGARERDEQATAVLAVFDESLIAARGAGELAASVGVAYRDGERGLRGAAGRAGDADATADERAEHGEEACILIRDGGGVRAVLGDIGEAVEQVFARNAHLIEGDGAVVYAEQAALGTVVAEGDAG